MIRTSIFAFALAAVLPFQAVADAQTLADIRQQLTTLYVDIQRLKVELSTTGGVSGGLSANTPPRAAQCN